MDHDLAKAVNIKLILAFFEQLSGLKINFHKSIFVFVLVRLKMMRTTTEPFLVVKSALYHSSI
jgi:hypothetical protein